ncbi:hypothetical protein B5807_06792 [Epicoccum nigrum]|uniref:Uncharacterized protein n=1 Tax=Epicoccum nigrum TaxID=105696 RepID=A0A1Y2LY76_EPING|nr:hypothetical protein B5807_06792 [Epicoccum nigrum]
MPDLVQLAPLGLPWERYPWAMRPTAISEAAPTDTVPANEQKPSLMVLPAEIRARIFEYVWPATPMIRFTEGRSANTTAPSAILIYKNIDARRLSETGPVTWIRLNKHLHQEAISVLKLKSTWAIRLPGAAGQAETIISTMIGGDLNPAIAVNLLGVSAMQMPRSGQNLVIRPSAPTTEQTKLLASLPVKTVPVLSTCVLVKYHRYVTYNESYVDLSNLEALSVRAGRLIVHVEVRGLPCHVHAEKLRPEHWRFRDILHDKFVKLAHTLVGTDLFEIRDDLWSFDFISST